jgi:predicted transcriptional regulator of viral defense system
MRMKSDRSSKDFLGHFTEELQAHGRYTFSKQEAIKKLKVSDNAFRKAAYRLGQKKRLLRAFNNFYVVIPAEYRLSEGLPAIQIIDSMMKFQDQPYYVGCLSAAALYGATHQAVQELQVLTSKHLRSIMIGRGRIRFLTKKRIQEIPVQEIKTQTGMIKVSTAEATAFDLFVYPKFSGQLNNIATVLIELTEKIVPKKLSEAARYFDLSVVQRLGYLFDHLGYSKLVQTLHSWIDQQNPEYVLLRPGYKKEKMIRNPKWHVIVNEKIDPDL